jgi:hypothetical protein
MECGQMIRLPGHLDRTYEPIASAMCGFYEAGLLWIVVERFPKLANNNLQNTIGDKGTWPDGVDEFLFRH